MHVFDLGHLATLDVLLEEASVTRAAARLGVSASALSRTLGQIRDEVGDELLVHSGRRLVPTPRALALRDEVKRLVARARELLGPQRALVPAAIARVFRIRTMDYATALIGVPLLDRVRRLAPRATLSFVPQGAEDLTPFRRGELDFDIGVQHGEHGELVAVELFRDRFVCAYADRGRARRKLTLGEFCARPHIIASRRAKTAVIIDDLLERTVGRRRHVLATASSFQEALLLAARTDALVAAPLRLVRTLARSLRLRYSPLPLATPEITMSLAWHARHDADPEHRWLRELIIAASPRA